MASDLNHRFSITIREIGNALSLLWGNDRKVNFVDAAYGQVGSAVSACDAQLLETACTSVACWLTSQSTGMTPSRFLPSSCAPSSGYGTSSLAEFPPCRIS
jgi:hypothetical protein